MLQQAQVLETGARADSNVRARESLMNEKSGRASGAVARDLGDTAIGVEQANFAIRALAASRDLQPTVGSDACMAIADCAGQLRQRRIRWKIGSRGQQKIILRPVRFEERNLENRHGWDAGGRMAPCAAGRSRSPVRL